MIEKLKTDKDRLKIDVSSWTIIKLILIILTFFAVYFLRDILIFLFLAFILSASTDPIIRFFRKWKISKGISIALTYTLLLSFILCVMTLITVPLVKQLSNSNAEIIDRFENLKEENKTVKKLVGDYQLNFDEFDITSVAGTPEDLAKNVFSAAGSIVSFFATAFSIFFIAIYLSIQDNAVKNLALFLSPDRHDSKVSNIINQVKIKLGHWMMGQFVLSIFIGLLTYIFVVSLGQFVDGLGEFALMLAFIAGITESIPLIGPIFSGIINTVFALLFGNIFAAVLTIIFAFFLQQFENSLLQPKIMSKAVGLNPIVTIIALMVGGKILGFWGMVLAVPISTIISLIMREFLEEKKKKELFVEPEMETIPTQ